MFKLKCILWALSHPLNGWGMTAKQTVIYITTFPDQNLNLFHTRYHPEWPVLFFGLRFTSFDGRGSSWFPESPLLETGLYSDYKTACPYLSNNNIKNIAWTSPTRICNRIETATFSPRSPDFISTRLYFAILSACDTCPANTMTWSLDLTCGKAFFRRSCKYCLRNTAILNDSKF